MTNEELLQQAKDQVIKRINKPGIKSWSDIQGYDEWTQFELHDEAAKLAIQKAREEAVKAIELLGTIGHDPKNPMWDALPDCAEAVNAAYANAWNKFRELAIEKLTAPGR